MTEQPELGPIQTDNLGQVRIITLTKPPRNLIDQTLVRTLLGALTDADRDRDVTGILLTGSGESFCCGLDVADIKTAADAVEAGAHLVELLRVLPLLQTPIAAAVNGDAIAGGASIICACDYAVAVPQCRIGTHESSTGFWPMVAQTPLIHRLGPRFAMENVGSGEPFTATRALQVGLVNAVVEEHDLLATTTQWLNLASRGWPGRSSFYRLAEMSYGDALDASLSELENMLDQVPDIADRLDPRHQHVNDSRTPLGGKDV